MFLSRGPALSLDTVWESFTPLQAAQQGVLPTEHWEIIPGTGTPSAAAEAVVGSLTHNVQLPSPINLVAGGLYSEFCPCLDSWCDGS